MSYIQELRKLVGSRPIIMIGTGVVLLQENQVLLQRRKDNGLWGIPGGSLELGETLEEAACREVLEEVGLEIYGALHLFNIYSGKQQFYQYPNGDQIYDVCVVYWTRDFRRTLKAEAGEVLELRFYALDDLPKTINPLDQPVLMELKHVMVDGHAANEYERKMWTITGEACPSDKTEGRVTPVHPPMGPK